MYKNISSVQNPLIKQILQLSEKSRMRRKMGIFVVEGKREILLSIKGGYNLKTILFCPELFKEDIREIAPENCEIIEINSEVYKKIAYRDSTEGIIAIADILDLKIENLTINAEKPLLLIAEAPEKPGNIGALLRTADAAKVDAVIIANPQTDLFNPNIIRSSVGGIFTNKIATGSTEEIIEFLTKNNIQIYCAALKASVEYDSCDYTGASAIVVGTEADGLSEQWLESSAQNIIIPMQGIIDSMNVSVAAGILIFEAKRQRGFK